MLPDRMDWRSGHLTTTEGLGGREFANKICPQGRAFECFSNARSMQGGLPGGCSRLELTRTLIFTNIFQGTFLQRSLGISGIT